MAKIVNQPKGGPPVMKTDERTKMFLQSTEPPITDADKETLNLRSKLVKGGDPELQKEFGYLAKQKQLPFPEVADPNYKYDQAINRLITKRNNGTASAKELQVLNYHFKKQDEYQNKLLQKDASLPDVGTQLLNSWKKDLTKDPIVYPSSDYETDIEKIKEYNLRKTSPRYKELEEEITYKLQLIPQLYKENNYEAVKGIQRSISDLLAENSDIFPQFKTYNTLNLISQKADTIKARQSINNAAANKNKSLGNQLATKLTGLPTAQKAQELEGAFMGVSQLSNMQFSVQDYLAGKTGPMGAEDIINLVPIPNSKFNQLTQKYLGKDLATPKSIMADEKERGRVALSSGLEMLSERPGDFYSAEALPAFLQNKEGFLQTEKYQRAAIDAEETFKNATLADYYDQFLETRRERANLLIYKKDLIAQHNRANELAKQLGRPPLPMLETEDVDNQLEDLDFQLRDLEEEIENIKTYNPEERYKKEYPLAYAYKQQHDYESARFNTPASLGASIFDLLTPSFLQRPGKQVTVQEKLNMAIAQGSKQIYDRWQDLDLSGSITSALFRDSDREKAKRNLWLQTGKYNSEGYTIGIDEDGNPVKSGQFFWTDKQGKYHFNPYATVESGLPVAEQMLETILLAEVGGAALGIGSKIAGGAIEATGISTLGKLAAGDIASALSLDAAQLAKLSNVANKGKVLLSPGVQQRLLTFGSVMATTYPSIYQEEYKNFKNPVDARDVALLRAGIESISESVIPNVASLYTKGTGAFLGIGRSYRSLLRDAVEGTTQKMFPGATNKFVRKFADSRFGQAVGTAGRYIKEKGKDLFQEAVVEEEAALFGNYFVDKIAKQKDSSYVMQNELTASNILKTAIEATAGMLITAPFMGGGTTRARNYDIASARWQVANNPEVFKSLATADFEAGKLTKEDYVNKVANINMMAEELKNLPINIGSIRDLDTLLEDKDAQLEYYSNYLQKQALNKLEAENPELAAEYKAGTKDISGILKETKVTEEQRKAYEESVKDIDKKLYKTEKLASIYDNLTYEQKEEIVAKNFQRKYEKLVSHEDLSPLQLAMIIAQHEKDLEDNPETYAVQNQAYIESLKNSLGIVRSNFMDFIRNNNDNLTFEQLDYKLNFLLQPNSVFLGENEYKLAAKDLSRRMALSVGPYEEIEDENEFIEVVARNFVTSKYSEVPLTSNGKPLLVKMMDNYVNEKLFDKFVEGLPKEERKAKQDELSEKFLKRVVELKQTLKEGQAFPEITSVLETKKEEEAKKAKAPEPAAAPQVREKYRSIYESYKEAKEAYNTEDANIYESMAAAELLKEATVEELLAGLESVKPIFEDVNVAKVIEDIQNGNTASLESLLTKKGVTKKAIAEFKDKLFPEITVQLPEIVVEEETADGAPEVEGLVELSEEPTEADEENENRVKVTQEKTRQEYLEQDRPNQVYLGITDTGFDEDRREDPNTDLIYSLVDRIQNSLAETNLRALGYHLLMKSDKDILALVGITPEYKEDYASFRAQFIINGIPVRSEATIAYYHKNFDLFGTYKVGIITDSNQSPLYFDKSGQKVKTGTPIIVNIGQPGEGPGKESDKKFKEAIPPQGQFVALSSFINGANVGREKIKSSVVGQLRLIVGQNETVTAESGKSYTLYKGVAYLPTGDVNFPYVSTYTPSVTRNTAVEVLALVKAFNEMTKNPEASTLPEYFKSMTLQEFHNYLNAYVYIPDNSKENSWGLVQTKRKGETERSHVKFFVRLENNKATVSLSEEDILNLLSGSKTEKGTIYAGIPKDFFNEGRTFRPFTVEDGKIKVGKITPFRNWFAQRSTIDKYSKTRPNRNLAFQKEDVVTLQAPTVTKEAPVSDIERKKAEEKLKQIWNSIGNGPGRNALEEGWAESFGYIDETLSVGGENYQAHGMGKSGFAYAIRDLFELFNKGIDPSRGGGQLYTAPVVVSKENKAGASALGTSGGTAYTDGAFVLVAKKGVLGIKSINDIGGILVNHGLTDINPEILTELRKAFPNLVIESYKNAKGLVEQLNKKAEAKPVSDKKADIEIITNVDKLKNLNQVLQSAAGKFGILSAKDNNTILWSDTLEQAIKKADIERRRDTVLAKITRISGHGTKGIRWVSYEYTEEGKYKKGYSFSSDSKEETIKLINDKYNEELDALEQPVSDKKADIEKTLYGTISGSIPLSQALPNGVYTDLGNNLFAYADKNEKIAAIVDRDNNYLVSKSFWNASTNKWQLPNQANLKDDAKRLGIDEATYIKKYQDAIDSLNKAELEALEALEAKPEASVVDEITQEIGSLAGEQMDVRTENTRKILNAYRKIYGYPPYTGSMSDASAYAKAFDEANSYYSSEVRRRLNRLEIAAKYVIELAEKIRGKAQAPKVETKVPTIEIGRYVQYSADKETYIITKLNANGTIQIYNPTKEGAAAKKSVSAKNLTPLEEIGKIVEYRDANYLVTPKNTIISLTTNKVMQWAEGDGNRKAILALANQAPQAPVITPVVELENPAAETIEAALQSRIEEPTYVPEKNDEVSFTYYGKDYTGLFIRKTLDNNYVIQVPGEGQKEFIASAVSNITKVTEEPDLPTDFGELERPKYLGNFISPVQNEKARTWTNTIGKKLFGEDRLIFEQTLLHPSAYAVWSKAATRLFKDSNYADVYHEAWHEFTQMYFTAEERKTLYDRARKVYGDLTDIELEEKLAEDFRQFMLTGVMPESIQKSKEARSIFQKILDFLSNFFTNKKTIDRYFKNLAKGKVGRKVGFPQFKTLYSAKKLVLKENNKNVPLSFQETKGYLDLMDQLFLYVANEAGKQRGGTYINLVYNPKEIKNIYNSIFNYIKKLRGEARIKEDFIAYNQLTRLIGPERVNFDRLKRLHFRNSPLFTNEIRLAVREAQEDEQGAQQGKDAFDQQEDGILFSDKSITERSQEDYADPLIINLIYGLPLVENGEIVYNSLTGAPILGEFETNWNILKNTLQNSPSYDDMLDKIKTLAKDFPQFNSLLELLPAKGPIKRASDQQLRNQFYNVFSMGRTPGVFAKFGANGKFSVSNTSSLDTKGVKDIWLVNFNSTKDGLYKQLSAITGNYRLDAEALFEAYPEAPKTPEAMLSFLGAIGFNYAQKSQEDFIKNASKYETAVYYIYTKLKSYHYSTDEEIFDPFTVISTRHSYEEDGETKSYAGQGRYLNNLVQVEVDSNPAYANDMVIVADGTTQYMVNPPTYQTKIINALNDTRYEYFEDLFAPYPFLDPSRNWGLKGSADIDYLFDFNNPVKVGNEIKHPRKRTENIPNSLEVVNLQGTQSDISIMNKKTIDLSDAEKHLSDIRTLLSPYGRTEENNRIGEKATTRGKRITSDKYFLFNPNSFLRVDPQRGRLFSPKPEVWDIIFNYIKAEVEITNKNSTSTRFDKHKYTNGVPNLAFFSHILSDELRTKVYDSLTKNPVEDNQDFPYAKEVADEFLNWVKTLTKASRINVLSKLKESENKETDYYVEDFDLVRYHFISFIHRVEQFKLFNYHPYYYKNAADVAKRISGANATGNYPVVDKENVDFVNSSLKLNGFESFKKYAEHENITILPREGDNPTTEFTYIVFKDTPVDSKTAKENREDYGNNGQYYINEERESPADTQDAASILTLDTFKKFFSMEGKLDKSLSLEIQRQEKIWTNLIETKINPDNAEARQNLLDALNENPYYIFSIKKLQYYGPGYKEVEIVPLFHKYSNKVLLPSEMVDNEELFNLAVKLYSSNADYGLFGSATKIAETISPVDFITEEGTIDITPTKAGVADLRFLKEQQEVEHKEDMLIIFATQFRKLLFRDMDTPKERELFATYKEQVEKLVDYDKGRFLKNIEDKELAVEFLINALSKKNVDAYTLDSIKYNEYTKDLQYSMDSILSRVVAESALMSETRKAIVRQKFYGSQFVQFPVSVIRPGKKLNFYRKKNGEILPAECIISFSPKYYSLFSLPFDKNTTIGELDDKGKPINVYEGLKRLNQKLAEDPSFREDNKEALRLAGVRIPVQGYNSMEYMEIVEFLPEESGDMILVPDELVVKSGGDFDIDKLFMYEPVLRDGKYLSEENRIDLSKELEKIEKIKAEKKDNQKTREELQEIADTFKTTVDKLKESLGYEEIEEVADESKNDPIETVKALSIAEERKLLQNQLLTTIKTRLSQPQIFEDLIEPNNVNNIKEGAKNAPDYLTNNFNKNTVANGREIWSNVVNPLYQLYVFQLASAKKMVGIAAKSGTFLTSAQEAKLNIIQFEATSQVYLDVHRNEKNEIELWRIKDVSGENKISQINSEAISGSVDILKNDDILRINFTPGTIPVVLYLNNMGARIKDVQKFIGEELIYRYDKGETFEDLLSEYPELLTKYGVFDQYGIFVEKATVTKISKAIKKNDFLTDETDEGKIKRLANFIVLKNQQSENITPLINTVDYDTANFQNFESIRRKINELDDLKKKRFFNADALEKVIKKSVVAPFEIQEDVLDKFAELFPISAERAFTNTIIKQYKAAKRLPKNKKLSYESFSRRYKNEFMTAVWQTISSEANNYIKYLEIGNEDNIVEKHRRLKVEAARLGINIPLLDTVMFTSAAGSAYVAPGMRRSESNFDVDSWKENFNNNLEYTLPEDFVTEKNFLREDFEDDVREFFEILAYTGILTSRLSKTYSSYLTITPEQIYTPIVDKKLRTLGKAFKETFEKQKELNAKITKEIAEAEAKSPDGVITQAVTEEITDKYNKEFIQWVQSQPNFFEEAPTKAAISTAPITAEEIYTQLGNKTKSENVVIKPWGELKDATRPITPEGIVSTRIKTTDYSFGNVFSHEFGGNLIKVDTIEEAVKRYINWILTGETGEYVFTGIQPEELEEKRNWLLEQLKSGELKGKPILYYKELGEPSHATALDYLINKYDWSKPTTPTVSEGIEINSKQTGLGNDLTNVHYATNGKSKFDIRPSDASLTLTPEAKKTWGESVEAWYKSNNAKSKGIPEGTEGDAYDMKLMIGLITDKLKQYPDLVTQITERGGLAFLDKSTHTMGTGRWSSKNPKNMFMNALKQAYRNVSTTPTVSNVEITKVNYTRQEVQNNPNTAYVFTENTHSITAFPNKQGGGSAIIRPEPNAFAIVTKKKYDYNTKENVDYTDTPEDFKEFTEVNTRLINELKNSGKSKIVFPQGFATDKAKMPTRFAEWLQKELLDNFGLVTELNSAKTGLISKSVRTITPTVTTSTLTNVNFLERFRLRFINNNPDIFNTDFKLKPNPSLKYYKNYNLNESDASVLASYPPLVTTDKITYADEAASKAMLERAPFEEPEKLPAIELEVINKASKKSTYSIPSIAGEIIEKEGYKLDIPAYPNVSLYLTNQLLVAEEGKTKLVKQNGWMVDVASFGSMSSTVYKNLTDAVEGVKDKVREVSQDPEKRKLLERIGFTEQGEVYPLTENPGTNLSAATNPTTYDSDIVNEINSKPTDQSECNIG